MNNKLNIAEVEALVADSNGDPITQAEAEYLEARALIAQEV